MPRSVEAPINGNVHSASRPDGNKRLVLAELRLERFHLQVSFDYSDEMFHFEQFEHNRERQRAQRSTDERQLLDKFLNVALDLVSKRVQERRFEKNSPINTTWVPGGVDVPARRYHPGKIPERNFLDRYPPFIPDDD